MTSFRLPLLRIHRLCAIKSVAALFLALTSITIFAAFDQCQDLFPAHTIPVVREPGRDLCFDGFAVYYSPAQKKPMYVIEKLNASALGMETRQKRSDRFYEEARLPFAERSVLSDYQDSGYDRGHNAPALNRRTPNAMAQSFSLANMMPQAPENNRGVWAKDVEKAAFKYVLRSQGDVYVYTGSVGNFGTIGKSRVVVPAYLYKLVYDPLANRAWAYWLPNTNDAVMSREAIISYSQIVQRTGIDFGLTKIQK